MVMMQSGKGGGLSEAFGGGGGAMQSLFGTKSTTVLSKITIILAIMFLSTSLLITIIGKMKGVSLMEKVTIEDTEEKETPTGEKKEEIPELPLKPGGIPLQ